MAIQSSARCFRSTVLLVRTRRKRISLRVRSSSPDYANTMWFPFAEAPGVGYLAEGKLIVILKLTWIVGLYSKRFTSQERLSHQIVDELARDVEPRGVLVYVEAEHFCTPAR